MVIFKIPVLDQHVLIFRTRGRYCHPDPPALTFGPFDCFVFVLFKRYELELSLKRWI
jgi:hypothetical protein